MASKLQIEANCRNANKSTGPRSVAGKKRARQNAYRHGLSLSLKSNASFQMQVDKLTRKIAGRTGNEIVLRFAHHAAEAALELERIRQVKIALIQRVLVLRTVAPTSPESIGQMQLVRGGEAEQKLVDALTNMKFGEPQQFAEALRCVLPDLIKLGRYEARAAGRRDKAIKHIAKVAPKDISSKSSTH